MRWCDNNDKTSKTMIPILQYNSINWKFVCCASRAEEIIMSNNNNNNNQWCGKANGTIWNHWNEKLNLLRTKWLHLKCNGAVVMLQNRISRTITNIIRSRVLYNVVESKWAFQNDKAFHEQEHTNRTKTVLKYFCFILWHANCWFYFSKKITEKTPRSRRRFSCRFIM